jgi:hypothetical protein
MIAMNEARVEDLLDAVPVTPPPVKPSPAQANLMAKLMGELLELDRDLYRQAVEYTAKMDGHWTPGRDGNISRWIDRLIAKVKELRAGQPAPAQPTLPEVADGRYAVTFEGEIRCYHLETGKEGTRWAGFRFLTRRSSDDLFPIKNAGTKTTIMALIARDTEAAEILYGLTVKECRRCHRALTDTSNPYYAVALGPDCGAK